MIEKIVEKVIEKDIVELVELSKIRIGTLTKLYFEYIYDIEHNMIESSDNPYISKYITSLNDILDLNLPDLISLYKLVSERLAKIIKEKKIDININTQQVESVDTIDAVETVEPAREINKKNIIKKKFKKPTKMCFNNDLVTSNTNDELFSIYKNNKEIINKFLTQYHYNTSPLENISIMNQFDINYWSRILNFALKHVEIENITIQEISQLYTKFKEQFDIYFMNNNIKIVDNFQELLEWGELSYDSICYITKGFLGALRCVNLIQNKIDTKDITEKK